MYTTKAITHKEMHRTGMQAKSFHILSTTPPSKNLPPCGHPVLLGFYRDLVTWHD